jgi:hypothetical protein
VSLVACPSPASADFYTFAAAYNPDSHNPDVAKAAALARSGGADGWAISLVAPDADPVVCRIDLGYPGEIRTQ